MDVTGTPRCRRDGIEIVTDEGTSGVRAGNLIGGTTATASRATPRPGTSSRDPDPARRSARQDVTGDGVEGNLVGTADERGRETLGNGGGIDLGASNQIIELNGIGQASPGTRPRNSDRRLRRRSSNNLIAQRNFGSGGAASASTRPLGRPTGTGSRTTPSGTTTGWASISRTHDAGVTPNDAATTPTSGANRSPELPGAHLGQRARDETTFTATSNQHAGRTFRIDYYRSDAVRPERVRRGCRTRSSANDVTTDASGHRRSRSTGAFRRSSSTGAVVTATATDLTSNTSEFSTAASPWRRPRSTSSTTNADRARRRSARWRTARCARRSRRRTATARRARSSSISPDTDIVLAGPLPAITAPVTIDGTSQGPGHGLDRRGRAQAAADGLVLARARAARSPRSSGCTTSLGAGIRIQSSGNTVQGFQLWTSTTGIVLEAGAGGNLDRRLVSPAARATAIWDFGANGRARREAGTGNEIAGNTIGLDPLGNAEGAAVGIEISATPGTIVGDDAVPGRPLRHGLQPRQRRRRVHGRPRDLLRAGRPRARSSPGTSSAPTRRRDGPGDGRGIASSTAPSGNQLGPGNTIARNGASASALSGGSGNRIVANSIHANGGLGIYADRGERRHRRADARLRDLGSRGTATVAGTMSGTPGQSFFIEYFTNDVVRSVGLGRGEDVPQLLGGHTHRRARRSAPTLGPSARAPWSPQRPPTHVHEDTSEFSNCATVMPPPRPLRRQSSSAPLPVQRERRCRSASPGSWTADSRRPVSSSTSSSTRRPRATRSLRERRSAWATTS